MKHHPELTHELVFNTGTSFFVYLDECTHLKLINLDKKNCVII